MRYTYQDGHPYLKYNGRLVDMQGQSHAITYDLLFHFKSVEHRFRPFVAAGAGVKGFVIAGPEPYPQPFSSIATLVGANQWKFVPDLGGGVRYRIGAHVELRAEVFDYISTFPAGELQPAPHGTARGVFNQITPSVAVSYVFPDRGW